MQSIKAVPASIAELARTFVSVLSMRTKMLLSRQRKEVKKMYCVLTKSELIEDLQTLSGLTEEEAKVAAKYVFENEDKGNTGVISCETRDDYIKYMEIGLDYGSTE